MAAQSSAEAGIPSHVDTRPCPSCGVPLEAGDRFCPGCGAPQAALEERAAAQASKHFQCKSCGALVALDPRQRSYVCPFCDSSYVVDSTGEQTGRQQPEFVIGFAVTPEEAMERFRSWIGRRGWFRPSDLRSKITAGKLQAVYLPFWSFSTLAESTWSAHIGEYWYRTETYTTRVSGRTVTRTRRVRETEWWPLSGRYHHYWSGYLVSGSRGLPQEYADRIGPYELAGLRRYEPYYLAGWMCEEYSVEREQAWETCREEFCRWQARSIADFLPGDTHRHLDVHTEFSRTNSDLILLPVYLLAYRYRGKLYRFLVNGQTGKTAGDMPLSPLRIALAIGAAVLLLLVLMLWLSWQ